MKALPIGLGTVIGIIAGFVLGPIMWLIAAGINGAITVLPTGGADALFFVGFASSVALGLVYDFSESLKSEKTK